MRTVYDVRKIEELLERVLGKMGPDQFSHMRLLDLEKLVRAHDSEKKLPGKTLLRATINRFRESRWPGSGPRRSGSRSRYF